DGVNVAPGKLDNAIARRHFDRRLISSRTRRAPTDGGHALYPVGNATESEVYNPSRTTGGASDQDKSDGCRRDRRLGRVSADSGRRGGYGAGSGADRGDTPGISFAWTAAYRSVDRNC